MNFTQRDVSGLIFSKGKNLLPVGNFGSAGHHNPVLGAVMMFLQA